MAKDNRHKKGAEIIKWAQDQSVFKIVITNLIFAEVLNFLAKKGYTNSALKVVDMFQNHHNIDIYYDDEHTSKDAILLFKKINKLGYVDSSTIVFYHRLNCHYLISFDSDFDGISAELTRLDGVPET